MNKLQRLFDHTCTACHCFSTALQLQSVKSEASLSFLQAMKDGLTVKDLTDQAAQLRAALTAAKAKSTAESAAAGQHAQIQQQLNALRADRTASAENTKVTLSSVCTHLQMY